VCDNHDNTFYNHLPKCTGASPALLPLGMFENNPNIFDSTRSVNKYNVLDVFHDHRLIGHLY